MTASSVVRHLAGVQRCVVGEGKGRVLESSGSPADAPAVLVSAMALAQRLEEVGSLLGLGGTDLVTSKGTRATWVVAQESAITIAVELGAAEPTALVEAALRTSNWSTMVERDVVDAEIEYVSQGPPAGSPTTAPPIDRPTRRAPNEASEVLTDAAWDDPIEAPTAPGLAGLASEMHRRAAPKYMPMMLGANRDPAPASGGAVGRGATASETVGRGATASETVGRGATASETVSRRDGTPSSVVPRDLGKASAASAPRIIAGAPAFAGSLQTLHLTELMEFLRSAQRTGALVCSSAPGIGTVYVCEGRLAAAFAPGTRPLSSYLVARGVTTLDRLLPLAKDDRDLWSKPAAAISVVKAKLGTVAQVRDALREQIRDALSKLVAWKTGDFSFDAESDRLATRDPDLEFDTQAILLELFAEPDVAGKATT